ncbi:hypothetical protein V2I01_35730 [Micromonospora sp. BRA006-A]|nr:hypothetical protein [Micromonospora sp. BRA006-A]
MLTAITAVLRPVDRAVRVTENEFQLVLPGLDEPAALEVVRRLHDGIGALARSYPFMAYIVHAAVGVTTRRPLPSRTCAPPSTGRYARACRWRACRRRTPTPWPRRPTDRPVRFEERETRCGWCRWCRR